MKIGSLFAGIGGFDLAAQRVGWSTAWYSEIEPYACSVMQQNFPGVPNLGDITLIDGRTAPSVDLLCGGFPCQDISLAGKGEGLAGSRSGLWSHYARLIEEIRPAWVVIENVSALRSRGLDTVLGALAALRYDAEWHCLPASAVGAPHRRDRVWIIAHTNRDSEHDVSVDAKVGGPSEPMADANGARSQRRDSEELRQCSGQFTTRTSSPLADSLRGRLDRDHGRRNEEQSTDGYPFTDWWLTEPDVGRVANGVPSRVDRLRCLGNAIVPQVAEVIFRAIDAVK